MSTTHEVPVSLGPMVTLSVAGLDAGPDAEPIRCHVVLGAGCVSLLWRAEPNSFEEARREGRCFDVRPGDRLRQGRRLYEVELAPPGGVRIRRVIPCG